MWKVFLSFGAHRILLFLVALFAINQSLPTITAGTKEVLQNTHSFSSLTVDFFHKVSASQEVATLKEFTLSPATEIVKLTPNAFYWVCRWVVLLFHFSPLWAVLVVANTFFFLFIWELNTLLNRMVTRDVAFASTVLMVLWPTTYEFNIGSSFSMTCCLVTLAIRHAIDNQWLVGGLALGILALIEPLSIALLPLAIYLFWYFQRHYPVSQVVKRTCFLVIPTAIAILLRRHSYSQFMHIVWSSAFFKLYGSAMHGRTMWWTFSQSLAGQTLTLLFFVVGAAAAGVSNTTTIHRVVPAYMAFVLLFFSSYGSIASRAPLAAVCLEGIAIASARSVLRLIYFILIALSVYEVYAVFR